MEPQAKIIVNPGSPDEYCRKVKNYISGAIDAAKDQVIGKGQGPVHHFYNIGE